MGEALLVRRGGAGGGKPTATPTITYVSKQTYSLTFKIKNNDAGKAFIYYQLDNATPFANRIELAAGATSANLTIDGLVKNTSYTVYTWAIAVESQKALSKVTSMTQTTLNLPAKTTLQNTTWGDIAIVSEAGEAANYWAVGDKKPFVYSGTTYQAQITGFAHDNLTGGGKAGISFQLENCLSTTYPMNSSDTNVGGWKDCVMRTSTMVTIYNGLPADLKSAIKAVDKITSKGNKLTTKDTTSDKLFLLSEIEIFGSITSSVSGEGSQYQFYTAGNSKIKKVGASASVWWERSPGASNATNFCGVFSGGSAGSYSAGTSFGVAFGFCI